MKLYTLDPNKKKKVLCGEFENGTFTRKVTSKHFMQMVNGYGIQEVAFAELVEKGCREIIIKETHTNKEWKAPIENWRIFSKVMDYGHGRQRFLSLKYMFSGYQKTTEKPPELITVQTELF